MSQLMIDDANDAKRRILNHAGHIIIPGVRSIIGQVRPYNGIEETDFYDLMVSLICVKDWFEQDKVDRELVYACWDFCRRLVPLINTISANSIITPRQQKTLLRWVDCVESFCLGCFHGNEVEFCLFHFLEYVASDLCLDPHVYSDLEPLLRSKQKNANFEVGPILTNAIHAISRQGV